MERKTFKDLTVYSVLYMPTKDKIEELGIDSIEKFGEEHIKLSFDYFSKGTVSEKGTFVKDKYGDIAYVNYEDAVEIQQKMREEHIKTLEEKAEQAVRAYLEAVNKYRGVKETNLKQKEGE